MSGNNNGNDNNSNGNNNNGNGASFAAKAGLVGAGVLVGLIAYPFVKKALSIAQPKIDAMLDEFTGKAESLAEKASDMLFKAKEGMKKEEHGDCGHDHDHDHPKS